MSKAENFIEEHTRNCSNVFVNPQLGGTEENHPWLSPDQARKAVEIAREEIIEWIEDSIGEYCYGNYLGFSAVNIENIDLFDQKSFIEDLKQAMKDE